MISESMAYDKRHAKDTWQCQLCEDILHTWHTTNSLSEKHVCIYACCVCTRQEWLTQSQMKPQEKMVRTISRSRQIARNLLMTKSQVTSWSRIFDEVDIRCWLLVLIWLKTTDGLGTNIRCQWERKKLWGKVLDLSWTLPKLLTVCLCPAPQKIRYRWSR